MSASVPRNAVARVRTKITGISHLAVYTSDAAATDRYYRVILGAAKEADPENPAGIKYAFSAAAPLACIHSLRFMAQILPVGFYSG